MADTKNNPGEMKFTGTDSQSQQMFGMNTGAFNDYIAANRRVQSSDAMLVSSMLSDVQEMIQRDQSERARCIINAVKFIIGNSWMQGN